MDNRDIRRMVEHGLKYPYDSDDDGNAEPSADWAHDAARAIIADLSDRRGIKWGFQEIAQEVREEIVETMSAIIRYCHERPAPADTGGGQ